MRRFSVLVTAVLLAVVILPMLSCSVLGLEDEGEPPIPSEVEHEGVLFRLHSDLVKPDSVRMWLTATNVSDTVQSHELSGPCMMAPRVAFREREWAEPAWNSSEMPGGGGCATVAIGFELNSGETGQHPLWDSGFPVRFILGDRLEAGLYRMGVLDVSVYEVEGQAWELEELFTPDMIAGESVRLERRASN